MGPFRMEGRCGGRWLRRHPKQRPELVTRSYRLSTHAHRTRGSLFRSSCSGCQGSRVDGNYSEAYWYLDRKTEQTRRVLYGNGQEEHAHDQLAYFGTEAFGGIEKCGCCHYTRRVRPHACRNLVHVMSVAQRPQ